MASTRSPSTTFWQLTAVSQAMPHRLELQKEHTALEAALLESRRALEALGAERLQWSAESAGLAAEFDTLERQWRQLEAEAGEKLQAVATLEQEVEMLENRHRTERRQPGPRNEPAEQIQRGGERGREAERRQKGEQSRDEEDMRKPQTCDADPSGESPERGAQRGRADGRPDPVLRRHGQRPCARRR